MVIIYCNSFAQKIKTYNGKFDGVLNQRGGVQKGKAIYQYYENEKFDRIYSGNFNYIGELDNIKGTYKNGIKDGKWTIYADNKIDSYGFSNQYSVLNKRITGSYKEGQIDGEWTYGNSLKCFNKSRQVGKEFKVSAIAHFKNGIFVGKISCELLSDEKTTSEGQFDNNGFKDGIWTMKYGNIIHITKYKHGLAYFDLKQNISTGDKLNYFDENGWVDTFWENYDSINGKSMVNGAKICIDTIIVKNGVKEEIFNFWVNDYIWIDLFGIPFEEINPLYNMEGSEKPKCYEIVRVECGDTKNNKKNKKKYE